MGDESEKVSNTQSRNINLNPLYLLLTGLGVGWLIGHSVSPILQIVIGSIVGIASALVAALAGINSDGSKLVNKSNIIDRRINALPLALFILGLAAGSSIGVYSRTNDWLGMNPDEFVKKWEDTKQSDSLIVNRLFDNLYPITENISAGQVQYRQGILYSALTTDECTSLLLKSGTILRRELESLDNVRIDAAIQTCSTDSCLKTIRTLVCYD